MKRIIREPLLHFLLIGAAFFLVYSWVGDNQSSENTIIIDESDLDEIVSKFETQWKRNPTEEELIAIVEKRIEEEVFYQEALKMGLDHNDEIIKRRLAQKMQFLSNDISNVVSPTEDELKSYYSEHSERYMTEARYTLFHVFFSPDKRSDFRGDAANMIADVEKKSIEEALTMGDEIALPQTFNNTSEFHISRQMGAEFVQAISKLDTGKWYGPVESGYGAHLVYLENKIEAEPALFAEVRDKVLDDYNFERQQEVEKSIFREFEKNYDISFDVRSDAYSNDFMLKMSDQILGE